MASSSNTKSSNINSEDFVTVPVAYNGNWKFDGKEWFFKNSIGSMLDVPKHITLSEITDILCDKFEVNKKLYHLILEVHWTGYPWFPVTTEIKNDQNLWVFISENSKTRLPLCVTKLYDEISSDVDEQRRKDSLTVFVAYNGKWDYDGKQWFFKNSESDQTIFVPKHITLSEIIDILSNKFKVDEEFYCLKLEVYYRTRSPWFPVTHIFKDEHLSVFISETSKTKVPLCVTLLKKEETLVDEERRKDDRVKRRLMKAIRKNDWVKVREIVNTEDITWTSKFDQGGFSALHHAVSGYKNNEFVRDILKDIPNKDLLVTTVARNGVNPVHIAVLFDNIEALKMMLDFNQNCLFVPDRNHHLPINCAAMVPAIKSFRYLFKEMKSHKVEFDKVLRGTLGDMLFGQVIDTGLVDVACELINNYPSMATQVYDNITPLERIIRKPVLFYSGMHYNLYQKFVYHLVPIENNSSATTDTADVENPETPNKDKCVTKYKRRCLHDVISMIWVKLWETTLLYVPHVKHLKDDKVKHNTTVKLLRRVCKEIDRTHTSSDIQRLYSSSFCLAVENDTDEATDLLATYLAQYSSMKDGHNTYQLIVLNRSEKVYNYILHEHHYAKLLFTQSQDDDGNNILHMAGRLAPIHKLNAASGEALQMQQELQWFKEVEKTVPLAHARALNKNKETPMMVFRKEHKELRKDGEEWMKKTADSYTITAALIITIVFAAAITVPGGNDEKSGKPIYETKPSFIIFGVADAISLFTATTSLLLFLSVHTARYADEDFLYMLPKRLIFGLVMLFVSVTSMMIAFSAVLYIMFGQGKAWILIPVGALACLPIASFVTLQFPLLVELISSTYGPGFFPSTTLTNINSPLLSLLPFSLLYSSTEYLPIAWTSLLVLTSSTLQGKEGLMAGSCIRVG